MIVHASTIGGNVNEFGGGGGVSCTVPTTGIFPVLQSPVFSDYEDNAIGGNFTISGLQTCWLSALRNKVQRSVVDTNNTFADPDADEVISNTIEGGMVCYGNSPAVQLGDSRGVPNELRGLAVGESAFATTQPNPARTWQERRRRATPAYRGRLLAMLTLEKLRGPQRPARSPIRHPRRAPPPGVGEGGLEPPHPFGHRNLNPARLPIPPLARAMQG